MQDKARAVALKAQGLSSRQIAGKLGISKTAAHLLIQETARTFPIIEERGYTKEQIWNFYFDQGLNTFDIEQITKINHETIRQFLHSQAGFKLVGPRHAMTYRLKHGGEIKKHSKGYILIYQPQHSRADCRGFVLEHLLVWEEANNRPLPPDWVVHHLNGVKDDNRPENLAGMHHSKHEVYIPVLMQRIRELEIRNRQLEQALNAGQFMLPITEN